MRCLGSSRSVMHVLYTLSCSIRHTLYFKSGEFGGHSKGKMNYGVSLLAKTAFFSDVTITSSLRSVVQVLMGYFTIFQPHGLSGWLMCAKNYEKLSKFVKVTAKILSDPLFRTRCRKAARPSGWSVIPPRCLHWPWPVTFYSRVAATQWPSP